MTEDEPTGHLLRRIAWRARSTPDGIALRFILDAGGAEQTLTWAELERRAWAARETFRARGLVAGDRVLLLLPTGAEHATILLGALWAGLVPTTLYPYTITSAGAEQELRDLIANFAPRATIGAGGFAEACGLDIPLQAFARSASAPEADYSLLQSLSYVQFTSGSTGRPRGLALEWRAIEANLEVIQGTLAAAPGKQAVSWLPMYHDMGMFGSLLAMLHAGCEHTLMDPKLFAGNPLLWLRVLHERRANITVAPPSALRACLDLMRRRPPEGLDLSCVQQVVCGAEPIPPGLPQAFAEVFAPYGVAESALRPCYGLAEATVAVSFTPLGRAPLVDRIGRQRFEADGEAVPMRDRGPDSVEWVSAGHVLPGMEVQIRDDHGQALPERRVGQVWLQSPSLYSAVLQDAQFQPRSGQWLDTGDLGYLADGDLYITGRRKDIIIKNGRNYSPERLEYLASLADGVRRCAAFGVFDDARSTERIVLVIEAQVRHFESAELRDRLRLDVRGQLHAAGYQVDEVRLVPKGSLPLTTSGKVRRQACREAYLQNPAAPG